MLTAKLVIMVALKVCCQGSPVNTLHQSWACGISMGGSARGYSQWDAIAFRKAEKCNLKLIKKASI